MKTRPIKLVFTPARAHACTLAAMNPENLLALASAKAIPLEPHESKSNTVQKPSIAQRSRAVGSGTHVYCAPEWTQQELGMAAKGLKETPWRAALYAVAGVRGKDNWDYLHRCLLDCATAHARREQWADTVLRLDGTEQPYLEELATLVLHAQGDLRYAALGLPRFGAVCLNVSARTWDVELLPKYETLQQRFECWLRRAYVVLGSWIHGGPEIARLQRELARRAVA